MKFLAAGIGISLPFLGAMLRAGARLLLKAISAPHMWEYIDEE